jgi:hypothetical protein
MTDLIETISNHDDEEAARLARVARQSQSIFTRLWDALLKLVQKYNQRHPSTLGFESAIVFRPHPFHSAKFGLTLKKTTNPVRELDLQFDINLGHMVFRGGGSSAHRQAGTILLDIKDGTPKFWLGGNLYAVDSIAEELMSRFILGKSVISQMIPTTPEAKERDILEALDRKSEEERLYPNSDPIIESEILRQGTSFGSAAHLPTAFQTILEILEQDKMIVLHKTLTELGVQLAPLGKRRLLVSEEDHQRRARPESIVNTFHAPVQQFAMSTGANSPIRQSQSFADVKSLLPLVETLLAEVKKHQELSPDAHAEADQLGIEAKKSEPRLDRIKGYLESLKQVASTVPPIVQMVTEILKMTGPSQH